MAAINWGDLTPEQRSVWSPPAIPSALDVQINGTHYKNMAIQPAEFITMNNIGFLEGCVIKRMCRWQNKDGVADLKKAIHEIQLLMEFHERKTRNEVHPGNTQEVVCQSAQGKDQQSLQQRNG